jgi:flagellar basal-body rod protein FlgB
MEALFGKTIDMLSAVLDFRSERHKVITSNIANIDTPNYKPKDLVFGDELREMMESEVEIKTTGSSQKRLPADGAFQKADLEMVETGQGVDLDTEMAKLAENNLMYNLAVELLARKFKGLDTVLKEAK